MGNAVAHAEARRVMVDLRVLGKDVVLEVADDGIGITPEQLQDPESFGLMGMRERAEALGGGVEIQEGPHGGTIVRAWVPVHPQSGSAPV